jgi:hypothetical protein
MDALAAEAFLNAKHRVYGLAMRPMSVGHAFTLEAIGSPFYHGAAGSQKDLRLAAWICSRPPLVTFDSAGLKFRAWDYFAGKLDFEKQLGRWAVYVSDFCAPPQFWSSQKSEKAEQSKIPSAISTVAHLMNIGMSEAAAWNTPVGIAAWYQAAFYENETGNRLDIVTDGDRLAILRMRARNG